MNDKKYKNNKEFEKNSANSQLDEVLDNLNEDIEVKDKKNKDIQKDVFIQQDEFKSIRKKLDSKFKDLEWYWRLIKKSVLILFSLQVVVYILSLFSGLKLLMMGVFDPLLLIVDFIFWGWLVAEIKLKYKENLWQVSVTMFLAGFSLGVLVSIFKFFWFREYWTIFNLIAEPVFMGIIAVFVGLVSWLFIRKNK